MGPKLAARLGRERDGAFLEYMGDRVEESLIWGPTTPAEVEELCRGLDTAKASGWDGVSPRVVRGVAGELAGSLSGCSTVACEGGTTQLALRLQEWSPFLRERGRIPLTMQVTALSQSCLSSLNSLRGYFR